LSWTQTRRCGAPLTLYGERKWQRAPALTQPKPTSPSTPSCAPGALETAKARFRNCGKKIESWGVDLKQLDRVIEFARRDSDELKGEFHTFLHYCKVLQLPLGTQLSLLDDDVKVDMSPGAKEEAEAWDAGQQGFAAGKNGEPPSNNKYPAGTLAFTAWEEARARGKAALEEGLVVRRGRPKGSKGKKNADPQQQAA
jgi:hypothetical protein